jgi:hypothetical protein
LPEAKDFSVKYVAGLTEAKNAHAHANAHKGLVHEVRYSIASGQKFDKVIEQTRMVRVQPDGTSEPVYDYSEGSGSVHAFINRNTGDLIKPGSWKAPAPSKTHPSGLAVRFNLATDEGYAEAIARCTSYGFLYAS